MRLTLTTILQASLIAAIAACTTAAPPVPATPASVQDILYTRPFTLDQGYTFDLRNERPTVFSGQIVVLQVDPALVFPRDAGQPVLYVGDTPAEPLNIGYHSGRVIAVVPDVRGPDGKARRQDLTTTPIWFGGSDTTEGIDAAIITAEKARANAAGIKPMGGAKASAARVAGGAELKAADRYPLLELASDLIRRYAPDEIDRADTIDPRR